MSHPRRINAFDLIVFDWDGTLVDSTATISESIRAAARDLGLAVPDRQRASWVIGLGLHDSLRHAVPDLEPDRVGAFVARYRAHFLAGEARLTPFTGIESLLEALHQAGHPMAVATGKSRQGLNRALLQADWGRYFVSTRTADEGHAKPHPWMLLDLMNECGVDPSKTLMVGDTTHDLEMAAAAGARAVAVSYGAHGCEVLARSRYEAMFHNVLELSAWLLAKQGAALAGSPERGPASRADESRTDNSRVHNSRADDSGASSSRGDDSGAGSSCADDSGESSLRADDSRVSNSRADDSR
jgi:phosphoglycolate phosphatase